MDKRHFAADGPKKKERISWFITIIFVLTLTIVTGCSSTGSKQTDLSTFFSKMSYEPVKGRVNQPMLSTLKFAGSDLPYTGCDFLADSITVTGKVPPGLATVPGMRLRPDMLSTFFEGTPTGAGDYTVQVVFNKISCGWKYDTKNYGDRTVSVKFRIDPK